MKILPYSTLLIVLIGFFAGGCGGGGGDGTTVGSAALRGLVVEVDGQTTNRDGLQLTVVETGQTVTTDADGRFAIPSVRAGRVTFDVNARRLRALAQRSGDDDANEEDDDDDDGDDDDGDDDDGDDDDDSDDDGDDDDDDSDDDDGDDDDDEREDDEDEDDEGRPVIVVRDGETVEIRISIRDGEIVEISTRDDDGAEARDQLDPTDDNPYPNSEAEIEVEADDDGEQELEFEVEGLPRGTAVEFFLEDESGTLVSIGTATANSEGEAELEFEDNLPLGARSVTELEGREVEITRVSDALLLFTGQVPGLPDELPEDGDGDDDESGRARSVTVLTPAISGVEGEVEMKRRPDDDDDNEFEVEVEGLRIDEVVVLQIEDPENPGQFAVIAVLQEDDDGEAEYEAEEDGALPFGVSDVADLVGLGVRITRDTADGELLLSGTIAPLVSD
ncbi:MAG: hypothetical protein AAGD14_11900 [Planctomycetota bacterium]